MRHLARTFDQFLQAGRPRVTALLGALPAAARSADSTNRPATAVNGAAFGNSEENILRVQGNVEQDIKMDSCVLYIEESGQVKGKIVVKRATICGAVSGDIEARERVTVKSTGHVYGSITAPRIALEEKGTINGALSVE